MADKSDLKAWVLQAVRALGGSATVVEVAEYIWREHETDLRASGRMFHTWQYDTRWCALELRKSGEFRAGSESPAGTWQLS